MEDYSRNDLISVVLPVFNEELGITNTIETLEKYVQSQPEDYELIFVNDGSKDKSPALIEQAQKKYDNIKFVQFSRNFGHQLAITAGIRYTKGDAVVVMDADLQDPPTVIPKMVEKWREGYQVVYGKRKARDGETFFKKFTAKMFYRILDSMAKIHIPVDTGDFRLMDRQVVNVLDQMNEAEPFVRGMVSWVGFKQGAVLYERHARNAGKTKYTLPKMMRLAMDGITSFSDAPLKLANVLGATSMILGVLYFLITLFTGFSTLTFAVFLMLFLSGCIMITIGIVGYYLFRVFEESKKRPLYIVAKTSGFENNNHPEV
ncbi:glycosyl transferase [Philodulcilactobacillus myokoensis]|uniref:Glycosyl transferase n=1 Tax=Philodulcilactobacillus myokoensis TaxID=2929573 RepID=A0A9W6B1V6_9LACO|nr:glycosyltransferase family 2 protein [Philodulcilactobacillus myokoensis]GLB47261.1 glycosyl transferase [Philodulcilactobacillus myokoensis]